MTIASDLVPGETVALVEVRHQVAVGVPFSLTCERCDAGDECATVDQALLAGWRGLRYDDGPSWNFLGICPECATEIWTPGHALPEVLP